MNDAELLTRADSAKRILDDPLVVEALATIERDIVETFAACPTRDLEGMRILQTNLRLARQFRGILQGAIERGKLLSHDLRQKETLLESVKNRFSHHAQKFGS